ncbi:olfactory receptor 6N1-like [Hyperolius riggenbachi]|uniref:olfactory receptor 6N1-like n=1 Tax=Hyperolius riggenbachi TaxID=752182 RepID=UPI0035A27DD5
MIQQINETIAAEVLILGFESLTNYKVPLFLFLLMIYTLTCLENILIIFLVFKNHHLHTPMYFLISNLLFCEMTFSTAMVPSMLHFVLPGKGVIYYLDCVVQICIMGVVTMVEIFLLTLMSYDRYLAICQPLRYPALMHNTLCLHFIIGFWLISLVINVIMFYLLISLEFCSSLRTDYFFCDFTALLSTACIVSDVKPLIRLGLVTSILFNLPFGLIVLSYSLIIFAILRMSSASGQQKAFSTCSSHLLVVSIYFIVPFSSNVVFYTGDSYKWSSIVYYLVPPVVNPIIYTLRNQEVHKALQITLNDVKQHVIIKMPSK